MMKDLGILVQTLEFEKIQGCGNSDLVGLEWSGFDPKSTPYAKKLVELQDSNAAPD
jgi:hypothetical protein